MIKCNPGTAMQITGWMEPTELLWLSAQATRSKNICEIGSWLGRSTRALADNTTGLVTAVDTWTGTPGEDVAGATTHDPEALFAAFNEHMEGLPEGRLRIERCSSLEAAAKFAEAKEQFDLVFIDANHTDKAVSDDIQAWFPLVVPGGIICGHDYSWKWPGVVQAVNAAFPQHAMVADTIWAVIKGGSNGQV